LGNWVEIQQRDCEGTALDRDAALGGSGYAVRVGVEEVGDGWITLLTAEDGCGRVVVMGGNAADPQVA